MAEVEMILCDDGPGEEQATEEIKDIFKIHSEIIESPITNVIESQCEDVTSLISDDLEIQSENVESPITDALEMQSQNVESPITDVLEIQSGNVESPITDKEIPSENVLSPITNILETQSEEVESLDVLETQSDNVENLNKQSNILKAQDDDGAKNSTVIACDLETEIESREICKEIAEILETNSGVVKENSVENTDVSKKQKKNVDGSKALTDILETQSECRDSCKKIANIPKLRSDIENDCVESSDTLETLEKNVEISKEVPDILETQSDGEESSKEIADIVEIQSDVEDNCMETSDVLESQIEVVEDPMDGCMEIPDVLDTLNENLEDPIKITDTLEAQNQSKVNSPEMADIVEDIVQCDSDSEDGCLVISDGIGTQNKKLEDPIEITNILGAQSESRENCKEKIERSIQRTADNFKTKTKNADSSEENTADFQKSTNISISSENKDTVDTKLKSKFKFKRRLIKEVRKQRSLYDTKSKGFAILDTKLKAWQKIATTLEKDAETCKQIWIELRYDYQQYIRKLRKFLRPGTVNKRRRPVMAFERELLFLWRFVTDRSRCPIIQALKEKNKVADINSQTVEDDDVVLVEDEPVLVINLEDNEDSEDESQKKERSKSRKNEFKITFELRKLVELLKEYPELYDISHRYYNDFGRRGVIWSSLANELKEKATKLMKLWIYVQTRYEWEINSMQNERTELQDLFEFLKPYIMINPNSVYKQSFFLRGTWQEPIEAFKIIFQLLATMRKNPKLIDTTITKHTSASVLAEYKRQWSEIGELRGFPPGHCESTWLIMRTFYWELINMRKNYYQLQDKWYFESIISELYTHTDQSKNKSPEPMNVKSDIYANSYAYSLPIPENPVAVKSFANTNALPKTLNNSLPEKQLKRKATGATPLKIIPILPKNISPFSMQLPSTQLTNNNAPVLPRHTAPVTFETELLSKSLPPMVSIDISSSPSPPPSMPPLVPITSQFSTANIHISPSAGDALSSNEILIELVASSSGNMLIINEATKKYSLNMVTTAKFIREVMAIPFIHNKELPASAKYNHWVFISNRFQLPHHIAIACWDFLLENFQHFDQIAPMKKLMAPFPNFKVWKENTKPFQNFHSYAVKKGWFTYMKNLPVLMIEMSKYPELYDDAVATRNSTVPLSILSKFPNIHPSQITEICTAFKNAFVSYMKDLEQGIANKWPEQWWHVLEKLTFLVDVRYHKYEPFYYIVKNKIQEEIERHRELEKLKAQQTKPAKQINLTSGKVITKASLTPYQKPHTFTQKSKPYQIRANVDPYSLILAIRRHPNIYESCTNQEKLDAWTQVAQKMNASVDVCRLNFQRAFRDYRLYIHRDPAARCRLNHRYFKHMKDIFRSVKTPSSKLSIRTPLELNQSLSESNETVFPERFIVDINMDNSNPALVMKNWSYAIGNLHVYTQDSMQSVLRSVFNKYRNQSASS